MESTETKVCSKCDLEKSLSEFYFCKSRNHRIACCILCTSIRGKKYRNENKEKNALRHKKYNIENKEIIKQKQKQYRDKNIDRIKNRDKSYRNENRDKIKEYRKKYNVENKNKIREYDRTPQRRLSGILRRRIREVINLQNSKKICEGLSLLGCSIDECRKYLESKFLPGMTWENYGQHGWHIDHILPCASFDLTKPEEQLKCFHYTNLQPLWAEDNLSKGDKIQVLTSEGLFLV